MRQPDDAETAVRPHDPSARALLVDYGGVLTGPVDRSFADHERTLGLPPGRAYQLLLAASDVVDGGPIASLERGELTTEDFDELLLALLLRGGHQIATQGSLLAGLFAGLAPAGGVWELVAAARAAGVRTALLSNSWGTDLYPRHLLDEHFDVTVISGEVGLRKPDPAIYHLAAERLGVQPARCAFVDDLPANVEVARRLGMFGVVHTGDDTATVAALSDHLGLSL